MWWFSAWIARHIQTPHSHVSMNYEIHRRLGYWDHLISMAIVTFPNPGIAWYYRLDCFEALPKLWIHPNGHSLSIQWKSELLNQKLHRGSRPRISFCIMTVRVNPANAKMAGNGWWTAQTARSHSGQLHKPSKHSTTRCRIDLCIILIHGAVRIQSRLKDLTFVN